MNATSFLTNHFLIAMPTMADPNFAQTVTYICEHNDEGAMGIVINQPVGVSFQEMLEQMEIDPDGADVAQVPLYLGGPVQQDHGFVLHSPVGNWEGSMKVTEQLAITTTPDILQAIVDGRGPDHYLVAVGYAGWGPGQLEQELADNCWLNVPADLDKLLALPMEARWAAAVSMLGIDPNSLSHDVGHA